MPKYFQFPNSIPDGTTVKVLREALAQFPDNYTVEVDVPKDFDIPTNFVRIEV